MYVYMHACKIVCLYTVYMYVGLCKYANHNEPYTSTGLALTGLETTLTQL